MIRSQISAALILSAFLSCALPGGAQTPAGSEAPGEATLTVADQELFDAGMPARWLLPPGWTRTAVGDGYGLRVAGAQAGLKSVARPGGVFGDVTVEGQFTFTGPDGTAQLFVRDSVAGAYVAQLDAAGAVTLEKRGPGGTVLSTWRALAEPPAMPGCARTLQLSAMEGALRMTVDDIDVLTAIDAAPLPPGVNKIGAIFATASGALTFDNYSVWVPTDLIPAEESPAAMPRAARAKRDVTPPANDDFAHRKFAAGTRYADVGDNTDASTEAGEPVPSAAADATKTVWYEFTPPASQPYLLTTLGSSFDTVLTVYTGTWPALTEAGSSDNVPKSLQAQLTLSLDSAQTYYIQVGGRHGSGLFEFQIANPADSAVPSTPTISGSAPSAPSAPITNNGFTNNREPVLAWAPRPAVTPFGYFAEISTDATFSSLTDSALVEHPTLFWSPGMLAVPPIPSGQKYYWRVAALNFLGQASMPSPAYSFTLDTQPPAAPVLVAPAVDAVVSTFRPALKWQSVADAAGYRAIIATDSAASTPYGNQQVDVTTTSYTPTVDIPQGEYWFAVESRDAAGNLSGHGENRRFVINLSQAPANGSTVVAKGPAYTAGLALAWTKVPGATYTLQIATDSSFTTTTDYPNLTAATFALKNQPVGTYYWRVNVNGGSVLSGSLASSFTVTPPLPEAPLIQTAGAISGALADKAMTNSVTPSFDWTVPANWVTPPLGQSIASYELQVATDSKFAQVVLQKTGLTTDSYAWDVADLPSTPGTVYYWRVRAVTNLGLSGAYSKTFTFTLDTELPPAPVITSPVLISPYFKVVTGQRPLIKWQPVPGAVRYRVLISTNFSGTTTVLNTFVNGTSFTPPNDLALGQYWLFVHAQDAAGNIRPAPFPGAGLAFNVHLGQTPLDRTIFVAKAPANSLDVVFTWEPMAGATTYGLDVAVDGDTSFTGDVRGGEFTGTTHTLNLPATNLGTGCYWRVYKAGTTPPAGYYTAFAILGAPPVGPSITTGGLVQDDVIATQAPVVFAWTITSSPADFAVYTYQVQVATDSTFTHLVHQGPGSASNATTYTLPTTLPPGTYYWRVRSMYQPSGITSPYSATYRFTVVEASATVPALLPAPAANSVVSTGFPKFQWKPVPQSAGYRARIAKDAIGTPLSPGSDVELTKTTFTPTTALTQGEYWFCVESKDPQGDWSGFGEVRRFVVNYALSPKDQAPVVTKGGPASVVLKWAKIPGLVSANSIRVEVDNNADFSSPFFRSPLLTGPTTSYTVPNVPIGTFYWRVVVTGHAAWPTSLAYRFTVTPPLPLAPVLEKDAPPALTNDATPHFAWKAPANWISPALHYQLQVAKDPKFTQLVDSTVEVGADTFYDWPTDLQPGTAYYWRVRGVTNLGVPGAFSKIASFTVDLTAPTQPVPKAPADATVSTSSRPTFSWTAGTNGAVLYRLEISSDPLFATPPVYTVSTPKLTQAPTTSLPQGVYYWRVHGLDKAGNGGDVSVPSRTVTIDCRTVPAEGGIIEAPTGAGVAVTFKWVAPTGVPAGTTYTIEIDMDRDGATDFTLPPVTTLTTTSAALPPGYYQYRLVASNGVGTTGWREFRIVPQ